MAYELETDLGICPLEFTVTLRVNPRIFMGTIRLGFYTTLVPMWSFNRASTLFTRSTSITARHYQSWVQVSTFRLIGDNTRGYVLKGRLSNLHDMSKSLNLLHAYGMHFVLEQGLHVCLSLHGPLLSCGQKVNSSPFFARTGCDHTSLAIRLLSHHPYFRSLWRSPSL